MESVSLGRSGCIWASWDTGLCENGFVRDETLAITQIKTSRTVTCSSSRSRVGATPLEIATRCTFPHKTDRENPLSTQSRPAASLSSLRPQVNVSIFYNASVDGQLSILESTNMNCN